jgi:hypothetical protein
MRLLGSYSPNNESLPSISEYQPFWALYAYHAFKNLDEITMLTIPLVLLIRTGEILKRKEIRNSGIQ